MARGKQITYVVVSTCCGHVETTTSEAQAKKFAEDMIRYIEEEGDTGDVLIAKVVSKAARGPFVFTKV